MIKQTLILHDDNSPGDDILSILVIHSDWERLSGPIARIAIVENYFNVLSEKDRAEIEQSGKPEYKLNGNLMLMPHMHGSIVLRTSGGHAPSILHAWHEMVWADKQSQLLPQELKYQETLGSRGGDYVIALPMENAKGEFQASPVVFTAQNREQYPLLAKALENLIAIAEKRQPFYTKILQEYPVGVPFRAAMARRHPNWASARHEYY